MSGNHTPTPWPEFADFEFHSDPIAVVQPENASENGGFKIAIFHGPDRVANAALAIAAVNSYASSQAEIERLRTALEDVVAADTRPMYRNLETAPYSSTIGRAGEIARAALGSKE